MTVWDIYCLLVISNLELCVELHVVELIQTYMGHDARARASTILQYCVRHFPPPVVFVRQFPVLHFPPLQICPPFSSPAFSCPANSVAPRSACDIPVGLLLAINQLTQLLPGHKC